MTGTGKAGAGETSSRIQQGGQMAGLDGSDGYEGAAVLEVGR